MSEQVIKFNEKLKELLKYAKSNKNMVTQDEILERFKDIQISSDKMDALFDFLEKSIFIFVRNFPKFWECNPIKGFIG